MSATDGIPSGPWTPGDSHREAPGVHLLEDTSTDGRAQWQGEDRPPDDPALWRGDGDGPMPLRWEPGRIRYPDLPKIDESAWPAVLAPLPKHLRLRAAPNQYLGPRMIMADELARSLAPSATDRAREAVDQGTPLPFPRAKRTGWRQVTVRIPDCAYDDLAIAANMLGTRPAELARMFVLNGTRRALADQDAND